MDTVIISLIVAILSFASAFIFNYLNLRRNTRHENVDSGKEDGKILTELGFMKTAIEKIDKSMSLQNEKIDKKFDEIDAKITSMSNSITRLETSQEFLKDMIHH